MAALGFFGGKLNPLAWFDDDQDPMSWFDRRFIGATQAAAASYQTITFVASGTEGYAGSGTTVTAGLPAGIAANDILVAHFACDLTGGVSAQTVSMPAEWTLLASDVAHATVGVAIWWTRYDGSTTPSGTVTCADATFDKSLGIAAFRSCRTTGSPFNAQSVALKTSTGLSPSAYSLNAGMAGCKALALVSAYASTVNNAPLPSGWTAAFEDTDAGTQNCFIGQGTFGSAVAMFYKAMTSNVATGDITLSSWLGAPAFSAAWSAVLEPALIAGTTYNQSLSATSTPVASLVRSLGRPVTAATTPVASLVRQTGKPLAVTSTPPANLVRQAGKPLSATSAAVAVLTALKVHLLSLLASTSSLASLTRQTGKPLQSTTTPPASLVRQAGLVRTAATTPPGSLVRQTAKPAQATTTPLATLLKSFVRALQAVTTPIASLTRAITYARSLLASTTPAAALARSTGKPLSRSTTPAASMVRQAAKSPSATSTAVATLAALKVHLTSLLASSTPLASLIRQTAKPLAATSLALAALMRSAGRILQATVTPIASLLRATGKPLKGSSTPLASAAHVLGKSLQAVSTPATSLVRSIGHGVQAASTAAAGLVRNTGKALVASSAALAVIRIPGHVYSVALQAISQPLAQLASVWMAFWTPIAAAVSSWSQASDTPSTWTPVSPASGLWTPATASLASWTPITSTGTIWTSALAPANILLPTISGTAQSGAVLTADPGAWGGSPNTFAYQWYRGGAAILGATAATYLVTNADTGSALSVGVIASNAYGPGVQALSAATPVIAGGGGPEFNTARNSGWLGII